MPSLSSEQFYSTFRPHLKHDFQGTDGQHALWFPGHPKKWGEEIARIELPESPLQVSVSDDDRLLAIAAGPHIHIYNMDISGSSGDSDGDNNSEPHIQLTLRRILRFGHGDGKVESVAFRPGMGNERTLVSSGRYAEHRSNSKHTVRVWDIDAEEPDHILSASEAAGHSASQMLAQTNDLWSEEVTTSQSIAQRFEKVLRAALFQIEIDKGMVLEGIANFNHDGSSMMIFVLFPERVISIVAVDGLQERFRLEAHSEYIAWAQYSPNDRVIGTLSAETIRIWNAENGSLIRILAQAEATITSHIAAFSPDSKSIAAGTRDSKIRIWDVESGELLHAFEGYNSSIRMLVFSPNGQTFAAAVNGGIIRAFDVRSGESLQHWHMGLSENGVPAGFVRLGRSVLQVHHVQYTARGVLVLKTTDGRVYTFDAKTGQKAQFEHTEDLVGSASIGNFATSHNGRLLISTDFDNSVRVWTLH